MGQLHDALAAATTREERHAIKAQAYAALGVRTRRWVGNRFTVEVVGAPTRDGTSVRLWLRVTRNANGNDVTPEGLNPIVIVNPPYLVADESGDVSIQGTDPETGESVWRTYREDLEAHIIEIIRDLLRQKVGG